MWRRPAERTDEQIQAGNTWQRDLIQPAFERLLGIAPAASNSARRLLASRTVSPHAGVRSIR
jgi:hypothetical protein